MINDILNGFEAAFAVAGLGLFANTTIRIIRVRRASPAYQKPTGQAAAPAADVTQYAAPTADDLLKQ